MRRGFLCVLRILGDMQNTECLIVKYLCSLSVEECMALAGICRMITDIQKRKNDNFFSDQVLVLLMFSNGRDYEVAVKIVVLVICILRKRC